MPAKHALVAAAVLAAFQLGTPARVQASSIYDNEICTATGLNVCLDFNLTSATDAEGNVTYTLVAKYTSSTAPADQQGYITAIGIYDTNSSSAFNLAVTSLAVSNGGTWCSPDLDPENCKNINELDGDGSVALLGGAREDETGVTGLQVGDQITITFTSTPELLASNFSPEGTLGLRAHVQSFGPNECSMKPDTRAKGYVFSVGEDCGPEVIPEPASLVLLATGLLGLAGVTMLRRMV